MQRNFQNKMHLNMARDFFFDVWISRPLTRGIYFQSKFSYAFYFSISFFYLFSRSSCNLSFSISSSFSCSSRRRFYSASFLWIYSLVKESNASFYFFSSSSAILCFSDSCWFAACSWALFSCRSLYSFSLSSSNFLRASWASFSFWMMSAFWSSRRLWDSVSKMY